MRSMVKTDKSVGKDHVCIEESQIHVPDDNSIGDQDNNRQNCRCLFLFAKLVIPNCVVYSTVWQVIDIPSVVGIYAWLR